MRSAAWMTLALVVTALAGCSGSGGPASATALGLLDEAAGAAAGISPQAEWVTAFAVEWSNASFGDEIRSDSPEAAALFYGADADPGDGKAPAWGYLFRDAQGPILVVVRSNGNVASAERVDSDDFGDSYGDVALEDIRVDSDEAAGIVSDNHEDYDDLRQRGNAWVFTALAADEEGQQPYWIVTVFVDDEDDDGRHVLVLVDARSGEYTDFSNFGFGG